MNAIDYLKSATTTSRRPTTLSEPITFRWDYLLDRWWDEMYTICPEQAVQFLRSKAAASLAEYIMDNCQFFDAGWRPTGLVARIEITLNDRGAYENMLHDVRREQRDITRYQTLEEVKRYTPYGFERGEFYD